MIGYEVKVNSRIEIVIGEQIYKTTTQDVQKDGFFISIPMVNNEYLTLDLNESIELVNYIDEKILYKIKCKVIGKKIDNGLSLYKMSLPHEAIKIQRRNYVRVDMIQTIKYFKSSGNEVEDEKNKNRALPALLLDLSGGGMRIKIKEELMYGDTIIGILKSGELVTNIKGKVVRKEKSADNRYIYGINFWEIDDSVRESIIKDVFTTMRKQREIK